MLIPTAQAPQLKADLTTARASVAAHLEEARTLQSQLAGDGGLDSGADADAEP